MGGDEASKHYQQHVEGLDGQKVDSAIRSAMWLAKTSMVLQLESANVHFKRSIHDEIFHKSN